jgi:D-apiose dehydrogenase
MEPTHRLFDVAIVGCGGVSSMHFEGYAQHPERVRIAAVCDLDRSHAEAAAQRWNIPAIFNSVEAMIDGASWDVGVVCTPTPVREAVVNTLAAAGKHLYIEKPLADSYPEAQRMVAACEAAGVTLAVDQNLRYHYPFYQARDLIAEGRIGKLVGITHQDLFFRQDRGWRIQHPRHALAVMGIHWLDGFRWMLGSEARGLICRTCRSAAIECVGETDAWLQITFENDVTVDYIQSFSSPYGRTETVIIGEEGTLCLHYHETALYQRQAGREPVERWTNPYAGEGKPESAFVGLNHLLTALETGDSEAPGAPNSGQDNLQSVALLDAAYQSAAEQRPILFERGKPI